MTRDAAEPGNGNRNGNGDGAGSRTESSPSTSSTDPLVRPGPGPWLARWASAALLAVTSALGLVMFCWPLVASVLPRSSEQSAPWLLVVLLPVLLVLLVVQLTGGELDPRTLALLGVLSAVNAALRMLSAGTGGFELVFFLLVLSGYVLGPTFGFLLGTVSLASSALVTGGVGPWLPFQMMAAGWVGLGAGLLGRALAGRVRPRGWVEIGALSVYAALVAYVFGALMNLWFWPFAIGGDTSVSYVPGGEIGENLRRFAVFTLTTSTPTWDTVRAVTNVVAVLLLGRPVLGTLRRAQRRGVLAGR